MLSEQYDRLRSISDDLICMDYDTYAYEVRRAADTIKSLSDNLSDMVDCRERARALGGENAKLRKLVQYILDESYGDDWFAMKAEELGLEARY